jgi:hypothetical protein
VVEDVGVTLIPELPRVAGLPEWIERARKLTMPDRRDVGRTLGNPRQDARRLLARELRKAR